MHSSYVFLVMSLLGIILTTIEQSSASNEDPNFIKIAAFNVQVFGVTKSKKDDVMNMITKIVQRYDIILIQEIRDKSGKTPLKLLKKLNTNGQNYAMKLSNRLGRTMSKESYAFYYRNDSGIKVLDSFHYDDGSEEKGSDSYEREPFVVKFSIPKLFDIGLIGLHVDPDTVVRELEALPDVFDVASKKFSIGSLIALGDFNAGCNYLSRKEDTSLPFKPPKYYVPLKYGTDTTVASSDCSYDRFIIRGDDLIEKAKAGTASVFKFDSINDLSQDEAKRISDHYPIVLTLPRSSTVTKPSTVRNGSQKKSLLNYSIIYGLILSIILQT